MQPRIRTTKLADVKGSVQKPNTAAHAARVRMMPPQVRGITQPSRSETRNRAHSDVALTIRAAVHLGGPVSNYLFVFAAEPVKPRMQSWFDRHSHPSSELRESQASPHVTLTVISHDLDSSLDVPTRTFFKGHMVDHRAGSVVFGLKGWLQYSAERDTSDYVREGQFLRMSWDARSARFSRDAFGMLPLLYTEGSGYLAVSDSMLVLTDLRKHMGDNVTPNEEVLLSRALLGGFGAQQISPDTHVEEISFVPARQSLTVSLGSKPRAKVSGAALDGLKPERGESYRDVLRTGAENIARLMATLTRLGDWRPSLSLSGGYDSRVPLAGAVAAGVVQDMQINTQNTKPVHADDFEVASRIAERVGFTLNGKSTAGRLADRTYEATPFMMWALSDLGLYDFILRPRAARHQLKHINLTGMGGEVIRGNYNWQSWPSVTKALKQPDPLVASALARQGVKGLRAVGVNPRSRHASELHYMNYRFALHGGSGRPMQMLGFAPLVQSNLIALAHSRLNERPYTTHYEQSIINDLCIVLSPELAAMPYDKGAAGRASKDISSAEVGRRLSRLGGPVDTSTLTPYRVYGSPDDVPAGPPEFMLSVARSRGMDRPQNAETVLELGKRGLEVLESESLRRIYTQVYTNGRWRLETKNYPLTGAAKDSPIKPVVLHALFGA